MNVYADSIAALEQELTEIDRKRPLLVHAIAGLRELAGGTSAAKKGTTASTKRTDGRTDGRTEQEPRPRVMRSLPNKPVDDSSRVRLALVPARDEAIRQALRKGPKPTSELLVVFPREPGQTAAQREDALRNALTRMRAKKEITQVDEGWAIA